MIPAVPRVLVIDADAAMRASLAAALTKAGHDVASAPSGEEGVEVARTMQPDIVVFDVWLPDMNGLELCRILSAQPRRPAFCVLTEARAEADRVRAFEAGVDDYVTKPHSMRELLLRLRSLARRRSSPPTPAETLTIGSLTLDRAARRVEVAGEAIETTRREFDLLVHLVERAGRVQTREAILSKVWGELSDSARVVDTTIKRLRKKLGPRAPAIRTVRGVGYMIED
jgi:two-component system, OmpR family, phosphate regulon response regulator PhoB